LRGGEDDKRVALQKIAKLLREPGAAFPTSTVDRIVFGVVSCLDDAAVSVRDVALHAFKDVIVSQKHLLSSESKHALFSRLLDLASDAVAPIPAPLDFFASQVDATELLSLLEPVLARGADSNLHAAVKMVSKAVLRLDHSTLLPLVHRVLPGLYSAFKHQNADVRKAVVFCLVDMYSVLGDDMTPFLSELNTSQLRLVTIYINRMHASRPGQGNGLSEDGIPS
jgi:CLIP-associating protein 1/2